MKLLNIMIKSINLKEEMIIKLNKDLKKIVLIVKVLRNLSRKDFMKNIKRIGVMNFLNRRLLSKICNGLAEIGLK